MINVQIHVANAAELKAAIQELANMYVAAPADEQFKRLSDSRNALSAPGFSTGDTDSISEAPPAQEASAEKPVKRQRSRVAEHVPAKEENVEPVVEDEAPVAEPSTTDSPAVAYADVQKAVNSVAAKKSRDAAIKLLGEFNASNGKELAEDQWAAFVARAEEVLA